MPIDYIPQKEEDFRSTKELFSLVQSNSVAQGFLTDSSRVGLWVPEMREGKIYLRAFLYASPPSPLRPRTIYRPHAHFTVDAITGEVVAYYLEVYAPLFQSVGDPRNEVVAQVTQESLPHIVIQQVDAWYGEFFTLLDDFLPLYAKHLPASMEKKQNMLTLYERLSDKELMPYYEAIGQGFFQYLHEFV